MDRPNRRRQRFRLERRRQLASRGADLIDRGLEGWIGGHGRRHLGKVLTFELIQGKRRQTWIIRKKSP
jgi:hypothetical protein